MLASGSLPKSPVSSPPGDEVPHMFTRKPRLQPGKSLVSGAKRLLQHNRPVADIASGRPSAIVTLPPWSGGFADFVDEDVGGDFVLQGQLTLLASAPAGSRYRNDIDAFAPIRQLLTGRLALAVQLKMKFRPIE